MNYVLTRSDRTIQHAALEREPILTLHAPNHGKQGRGGNVVLSERDVVPNVILQNQPPAITGQTLLSTQEDTPLSITLSNLTVTDPDNNYPADFTLVLSPGDNYTLDGNTVIPTTNFAGPLSVPAVVNDGNSNSPPFNLQIAVSAVNDAPIITGQLPLATPENTGIAIDVSHLIIDDPDNATFTLSIVSGSDYTVSGSVVTPNEGFNGDLTVNVFVNDGSVNSNEFGLVIAVNPVNDPPTITGQREIEIAEDTPLTISVEDVLVSDPDNSEGFTLLVQPGDGYTFEGNVVTPAANVAGPLYVNVVVTDGTDQSAPFALLITVNPVNDAPSIDGQVEVTTAEETVRTITFSDLIVSDPDNNYPEGFSLTLFPGSNYAFEGHTVLPAANYAGELMVPVQVNDGELSSNVFQLRVTVVPTNDKPVITGQIPVQIEEDVPITLDLSYLTVLDEDNAYPGDFTLSVAPGPNYTVDGTTVYPAANFNGVLNVSLTVNDGIDSSDPFIFQIQVGVTNDAPTITGQTPLSTDEEQPVTITLSHLTVTDPDNAYPTGFTLLISPGVNYTVAGQTITPALNFAGVITVPLRVNDGVNNSPTFDFQLQVNQINDPPSFAAIPNQQVPENTPAGSITIRDISKGPMENDQQLTFIATSGNTDIIENPVVQYNGTGRTAVLSYVIKPNRSGLVTITVVAVDNGSNTPPHQNSYSSSFQVEVQEINAAPTLDPISDLTIQEDSEQQNISLTGITAGAGETQTLTVSASTDKPEYFDLVEVDYTSPATTGVLRLNTKANAFGRAVITVTITDNGPGISPHVNSVARKFAVVIQPVNDPPVFTSEPLTLAVIGETYQYNVVAVDPDGDKLAITAPTKPPWASLSTSNGSVRLNGKPPQGVLGDYSVTLQASDGTSVAEQKFVIYVNVRPETETLSVATGEDTPFAFPSGFFMGGYSDQNDNLLQAVQITTLPTSGALAVAGQAVNAGDTIPASSLEQLSYVPVEDFYGDDSFGWNAYDGYHFGARASRVDISVVPVNDPPRLVLQEDTLQYEVDGAAALLAPLLDIIDPDDDTLARATLKFRTDSYRPQMDILEFETTGNIRGQFSIQTGVLEFTGVASVDEYRTVLRSVRYTHLNTLDPILEPKMVTWQLYDGKDEGESEEKIILLQYTFVEFDIPTAFTPNGDHANDTWIIDRPGGGLEDMDDAVISVYNKHGVLVYRAKGFDKPWDGTMDGALLPADTYFFTIDLQLRNRKTYKGIVTILR